MKMTYEDYEMKGGGHHDAIVNGASRIFAFFDKHSKPQMWGLACFIIGIG